MFCTLSCIYEFVQLLKQLLRSQSDSAKTKVAQSQCAKTRTQAMRPCQDTWHSEASTNNPIHLDVNVQQRKHMQNCKMAAELNVET